MAQKVIQIGSSVGVTIPKAIAEAMQLRIGDAVEVMTNADETGLSIVPSKSNKKPAVSPELIVWTDTFINRNRELLERLSKK